MTKNYGEDFFTIINSEWLDSNPIPNDRSRWCVFHKLGEENDEKLEKPLTRKILKNKSHKVTEFLLYLHT